MNTIQNLLDTARRYRKTELLIISSLFFIAVGYVLYHGFSDGAALQETRFKPLFEKAGEPFDYYENYLIPTLIRLVLGFCIFLYLNFVLVRRLITNSDPLWNILRTVLLFFFAGFMLGATNVMFRTYLYAVQNIEATLLELYGTGFLYAGFWFAVFGFYTLTRFAVMYMLDTPVPNQSERSFVRKEGVVAFLVWACLLLLMLLTNTITLFTLFWIVLIPPAIVLYLFSFYRLIPESSQQKKPFRSYLSKVALILAALFFPVAAFVWVILHDGPPSVMMSIINTGFQLLVTVPVSWRLYKRDMKGREEIITLKKELGKSNANFDFLRSQINPHFLFNALNTLYGTAIEEQSERTSEGIQKLGDMMRFMLHDNMQEKISLAKEVDYIDNYISLQRLRTDATTNIMVNTNIGDEVKGLSIAPMLLIPFVENAFKHGISFREASHITITLQCTDNTLQFDVSNSKHQRTGVNPEKYKSGVGLQNVKQRLQLLYPDKHQLTINETEKEYNVSLSIKLT